MKKFIIILLVLLCCFATYYGYKILTKPQSPFKKYAHLIPGTYRIGFTNLEQEVTNQPLKVQGTIPSWLSGTLYRNGPALFYTPTSWVSNWFDGLAMIHAFALDNGQVSYTNKFLKTTDYHHVQKTGKMNYAGFMQDPCASIFKNLFSFFTSEKSDSNPLSNTPHAPNANVSFVSYANRYAALTEIPLPVEFDPATLETVGVIDYQDQLPKKDIHDTPHPHYDPVKKEHLGYFTQFDRMSTVNLFSIPDGTITRRIIYSYNVEEPSYMHSFAITKQYAILTALPLVVNPLNLLLGKPFIQSFTWKPELGTKLIVINRRTGTLKGIYTAPPFFAFHTVNAYEEKNLIHLDIVTYSDPSELYKGTFENILAPDSGLKCSSLLTHYTINLSDETVTSRIIAPSYVELPRINYAFNGKPYTYVYAEHKNHPYVADGLIKINVVTGESVRWHQEGCFPGEPIFVAHPQATQEDEGIVLSVVLDIQQQRSFLVILNAQTFTEIARTYAPTHLPFGIHGQFFQ